jgi:hypothetical protein
VASRPRAAIEGVRLEPAEAVAITLELAEQISSAHIAGVPEDVTAVELSEGGELVVDPNRLGEPSPRALAGLLHSLLTMGGERPVPGALMLTIARAKGEIDLSGFATLSDLVTALQRFAPADPRQAIAALYDRLAPPPLEKAAEPIAVVPPPAPDYEPIGGFSPMRALGIAALLAIFFAGGWFVTSLSYGRGPRAEPPASPRDEHVGTTGPVAAPDARRVESTAALEGAYTPSFVPSGEAFFFQRASAATGDAVQTSGDRDTQLLRVVDEGAKSYHVRPSPDGAWIAFDSDRDGARGVYVGRVDGTEVRRVSGPGHAAMPSWSPDGGTLAFVKAEPDRPGAWNVWLLDLATNETRRVTEFSRGLPWGASWFPDGRRIVYSHEDRLVVHDLTTGTTRTFQSPEPGRLVRTPVVSPDGTRIIYQVYGDGVWMLDVGDGSARRILDDPTAEEFVWDPQGGRVAFHSRRGGGWSIFVMAAGT